MKIIEGHDVKIFTDNIEENALEQIKGRDYIHGLNGNTLLYGIAFRNKRPTVVSERTIL